MVLWLGENLKKGGLPSLESIEWGCKWHTMFNNFLLNLKNKNQDLKIEYTNVELKSIIPSYYF